MLDCVDAKAAADAELAELNAAFGNALGSAAELAESKAATDAELAELRVTHAKRVAEAKSFSELVVKTKAEFVAQQSTTDLEGAVGSGIFGAESHHLVAAHSVVLTRKFHTGLASPGYLSTHTWRVCSCRGDRQNVDPRAHTCMQVRSRHLSSLTWSAHGSERQVCVLAVASHLP